MWDKFWHRISVGTGLSIKLILCGLGLQILHTGIVILLWACTLCIMPSLVPRLPNLFIYLLSGLVWPSCRQITLASGLPKKRSAQMLVQRPPAQTSTRPDSRLMVPLLLSRISPLTQGLPSSDAINNQVDFIISCDKTQSISSFLHGHRTPESSFGLQSWSPLSEALQLMRFDSVPVQLTSSKAMKPLPRPNMKFARTPNGRPAVSKFMNRKIRPWTGEFAWRRRCYYVRLLSHSPVVL